MTTRSDNKTLRVAVAGFALESVSFLPGTHGIADFEKATARGTAMVEALRGSQSPVGGFVDILDAEGVEIVPLTNAHLGVGGNASDDAFDFYRDEICAGLRGLRDDIDGVLLFLHGAMTTPTRTDPESAFMQAVRDAVGPDMPVIVASDLHANVDAGFGQLADDCLGLGRMLLEPGLQTVIDQVFDDRPNFRRDKFVFGLRGELGIGDLDRENRRQPLAAIVAGQRNLFLACAAGGFGIGRDLPGQGAAKAGEVGSAVTLRNVVGKAQDVLVVRVVPLHRDFDGNSVAFRPDDDRFADQRMLCPVEKADKGLEPAFVHHRLALRLNPAPIGQHDLDPGIEERELSQPVLERGVIKLGHREGLRRRQKRYLRAVAPVPVANHLEGAVGDPVGERDFVGFLVAPDTQRQRARQGIDNRDANAVQAA